MRIAEAPLQSRYQPELDVSEILGPDACNYFQNLIRIINWIVEQGRLGINNLVACLSNFLVNPRDGHL